jgi:hypothetical protein
VREKARAVVAEMIRAQLPEDARDLPIRIRWSDEFAPEVPLAR